MIIEPFAYRQASRSVYRAYNALNQRLRAERLPGMPPISLEESINRLQNVPSYLDMHLWFAWNDDHSAIIGLAETIFLRTEENRHMMSFSIGVLPEFRRQGIGHHLLAKVAAQAQENGRTWLLTTTYDSVPAGEQCMWRLGATPGLDTHLNKLDLANVDRTLLQQWQQAGQKNAGDIELGLWVGPFPDEELPAIAQLLAIMNQQPRGILPLEDIHYTPELVREMDSSALVGNIERWTLYARERQGGELVGYTAVYFHPDQPQQVGQGDTGVFPQYRGRGIGRWLKAAMLQKILAERPAAQSIITSNADCNAPMLKINEVLGYKPYLAQRLWQIDLATVLAYVQPILDLP